MNGYIGKMLFVNLSDGTHEVRELSEEMARNFLGGPALGARVLFDEMPANCDPYGEDSMIGFVTGPTNGTRAFFGGRYTVVSKSPVTGGWNDANSGGFFGPSLRKAGYDAVFVKGIAKKPVYIFIDDGAVEICDAGELWGKTILPAEEILREKYGKQMNAALIGPAGERKSLMAAVMNDGHRAAGRGGSGAVMGSKNLKALVVRGDQKVDVPDAAALTELNKRIATEMKEGPRAAYAAGIGAHGTGVTYVASCLSGDASVKNWGGSGVTDYPEEVATPLGSPAIDEKYMVKKYHCSACPVGCGAFLNVPSEKWDLSHSPRPEYETQGMFGSQMLCNDVEALCRCNDLCNEYGLDTISTGGTVAWLMECYENGLFTLDEMEGIPLNWGNADAMVAMTEKVVTCAPGLGEILAMGSRAAADKLGRGHEYLVVASGIEEPQHDSRLAPGLTRIYQYDPTPGRHVKGGAGIGQNFDHNYEGTGPADKAGLIGREICNAAGLCMFGQIIMGALQPELVNAVTGFNYTPEEYAKLGVRSFAIRQAFNLREGMTRKDYTLSERLYKSNPPHDGPLAGVNVDHEKLADNFFDEIGWGRDGAPTKETLAAIGGLEAVSKMLYG